MFGDSTRSRYRKGTNTGTRHQDILNAVIVIQKRYIENESLEIKCIRQEKRVDKTLKMRVVQQNHRMSLITASNVLTK